VIEGEPLIEGDEMRLLDECLTSRIRPTAICCGALTVPVTIQSAAPSGAVDIVCDEVRRINRDADVLKGTMLLVTRGAVGEELAHPHSRTGWARTPRTGPTNTFQIEEDK
jgi:hypothetical protein